MRHLRRWWWAVVIVALLSVVPLSAALTDYAYQIPVSVSNDTGSTLTNAPVAVTINADDLADNGFVQADGDDVQGANSDGTSLGTVVQGMNDTSVTWWLDVDSLADGTTATYYFHTGDSDATRDQSFRFDGTGDYVSVTDHADLDITDELTMLATVNLNAIPSGQTWIWQKPSAYGLYVQSGNTIGATVYETLTETLRPDSAGDSTQWLASGCSTNNWDCVNDTSADDATTYVFSATAGQQDWYNLTASTLTAADTITQVEACFRGQASLGTESFYNGVKLGGGTTYASHIVPTAWTTYCDVMSRPGGGAWAVADLASLQVGAYYNSGVTTEQVTQQYVVVTYTHPATATWTSAVADTTYYVKGTFDGTDLKLYADTTDGTTLRATTTSAGTINTNASDITIGASIDGDLYSMKVGTTSVASPTYVLFLDFEPEDLEETQVGTTANSWTYGGSVEDLSSGTDQDGTYTLTRSGTNITVYMLGIQLKNSSETGTTGSALQNVIGTIAINPQATKAALDENSAIGIVHQPARLLQDQLGVSRVMFWWVMATVFGVMLGFVLALLMHNLWFFAFPVAGAYALSYSLGDLPMWMAVLSFVVLGLGIPSAKRFVD